MCKNARGRVQTISVNDGDGDGDGAGDGDNVGDGDGDSDGVGAADLRPVKLPEGGKALECIDAFSPQSIFFSRIFLSSRAVQSFPENIL